MTQKEKIAILKDTIYELYSKEGRSKSYIAKLLKVNRKELSIAITDWKYEQANVSYLTPSNKKFANKHKDFIISKLNNNVPITKIAEELNVSRYFLSNIIEKTHDIKVAKDKYDHYRGSVTKNLIAEKQDKYYFNDLPNEIWIPIKYHEKYQISNYGRVKSYLKRYNCYRLIKPSPNIKNSRLYVIIDNKNLQLSRLVGYAFVDGHSEINNTINHIDGDTTNNNANNLEWISKKVNNKKSYDLGRNISRGYQKYGRFKKIILDNKYEFKTLVALAKFLNVSVTQLNRYIDKECNCNHTFKFIY